MIEICIFCGKRPGQRNHHAILTRANTWNCRHPKVIELRESVLNLPPTCWQCHVKQRGHMGREESARGMIAAKYCTLESINEMIDQANEHMKAKISRLIL